MLKVFFIAFFALQAIAWDPSDSSDSNNSSEASDSSESSEPSEASPKKSPECNICLGDILLSDRENEFGSCHGDCFLQWLEKLINDGNFEIPLFQQFKQFDSDRTVKFYENKKIIKFIHKSNRPDIADKLSKNMAKNINVRDLSGIPCPYGDCDGMFINPARKTHYLPLGKPCPVCERLYEVPKLDKKTLQSSRLCPNCGALVIKVGGCTTTHCGSCRHNFDWTRATEAKQVYKRKKQFNTCSIF